MVIKSVFPKESAKPPHAVANRRKDGAAGEQEKRQGAVNCRPAAVMAGTTISCGRYVGRIGALAVALGVGAAVATSPGIAFATPTESGNSPTSTTSGTSSTSGPADEKESGASVKARKPDTHKPAGPRAGAEQEKAESVKAGKPDTDKPAGPRAGAKRGKTESNADDPEPADESDAESKDSGAADSDPVVEAPPAEEQPVEELPAEEEPAEQPPTELPVTEPAVSSGSGGSKPPAAAQHVIGAKGATDETVDPSPVPTREAVLKKTIVLPPRAENTEISAVTSTADTRSASRAAETVTAPTVPQTDPLIAVASTIMQTLSALISPMLAPMTPANSPANPVMWAVLGWVRRQFETLYTAVTGISTLTPDTSVSVAAVQVDRTAELQAKFDALKPGDTLTLEQGVTYLHNDGLFLRVPNITINGNGATLQATNSLRAPLVILADGVTVKDLNLTLPVGIPRNDGVEKTGLIVGGNRATVSNMTITGGSSAGVYVGTVTGFRLDNITVQDTGSDGIQIAVGANNGVVNNPKTYRTGDDGIAVLTSLYPATQTTRDIVINNPVVNGSLQRGIVVEGGQRITINNVDISNTACSGLFVGTQNNGVVYSLPTKDVVVTGGTITNTNTGGTPMGAVTVLAWGSPVSNVTISNIKIVNTPSTAYTNIGVGTYWWTPITNIKFQNINLVQSNGVSPVPIYGLYTWPGTYTATGFTMNGRPTTVV